MTREIALVDGRIALVDDCDFDWLSQTRWTAVTSRQTRNTYARANVRGGEMMHRMIMRPADGLVVDHINRDGLDNRRENLRVCTTAQNARNARLRTTNTSGYRGVSVQRGRYRAALQINGAAREIGRFDDPVVAAVAYDAAAEAVAGEFAGLNFPKHRDWLFAFDAEAVRRAAVKRAL